MDGVGVVAAGVVMAVTANAVISRPDGFWPWLVTVTPPVSVVFLSLILEQIALTDIKRRHSNERAYQRALNEWQAALAGIGIDPLTLSPTAGRA